MKELEKLTEGFETSRPIFRLTKTYNGSTIDAELHPAAKYKPTPEEGNILSELVCEHYRENFDMSSREFTVDHYNIANSAMEEIRGSMAKFLEKNLEMKSPTQSKIYRWFYRNLPNNNEFNDTLVMVYKYMRSFSNEEMKSSNVEHINNAIALLGAIMEKYDEQD